jgi:asparagine synthase (glutamine-hydrolysing)
MPTDGEAKEELLAIYKRAVKRHLLSDVPVGLLLSGGIDSGLLLGLMNLSGNGWPTYTVGYGSSFKDDELTDAARTAEVFSARNNAVAIDRETFESTLPKIVSCLEEPIASSSIVPMYFVCERARQDVKVALVGQGPDELFGGYIRHLGVRYGAYWRALPRWLQKVIRSGMEVIPRNETWKRAAYSLNMPDRLKRYQQVFSLLPGREIDALFRDGVLPRGQADDVPDFWSELQPFMEQTDELGGFQFLEMRSSLPDELLMYADKLSMAHSLEVRVPYLDREIVEYVERLHAGFKVRYGVRKWLHRNVCRDFLPREIVRRKKRGFAVNVVDDWFQNSLNSKLEEKLLDERSLMYQYLQPQAVRRMYQDHASRKRDNHKVLFSLIVLEQWLRSRQ